ncbi:MAG: hypothetical protein ABFD00_03585 [Chloroherpetonaceae bacterium]
MKKLYWVLIIIVIGLSLFLIFGQDNKKAPKNTIYELNREWKFAVKVSNSNRIDTIALKIVKNHQLGFDEKEAMWSFVGTDSLLFKNTTDTATIEYFRIGDFDSSYVSLPSPRIQYFKMTRALPSPIIELPVHKRYKMSVKVIEKIINDQGEFDSLAFTGKIEVVDKVFYDNPSVKDWCWVVDAVGNWAKDSVGNKSSGTYKAKYYFNEKYGFVYFYYDFNTYNIKMEPIFIKY